MKRHISLILLAASVLTALAGCGLAPTQAPSTPPPPTVPAAIAVTDDLGKSFTFDSAPQRIVSLAPSVTEILFAIGAGGKVVGVSDFTTYPPEAAKIESVGGMPVNFEKVVALQPDLVIGADINSRDDISKLTSLGLNVFVINKADLDGIFANIEVVGKAVGAESAAKELADSMRKDLQALKTEVAAAKAKPRVFVELDETLYTVGPGSFIQPLIEIAGGTNIAADAKSPYPQLSAEQIISRDPEVILLTDAAFGVTADAVKKRPGWDRIAAIRNSSIIPVDADMISRPGPRIVKALRELAALIHPELSISK